MSILDAIVHKKRERLSRANAVTSLAGLRTVIKDIPRTLNFEQAIKRSEGQIRLIAEVKKASPSKGLIRQDFDHKAHKVIGLDMVRPPGPETNTRPFG